MKSYDELIEISSEIWKYIENDGYVVFALGGSDRVKILKTIGVYENALCGQINWSGRIFNLSDCDIIARNKIDNTEISLYLRPRYCVVCGALLEK
jgi:hypothetical protein